jgi:flagellar hook-length control protein FliK
VPFVAFDVLAATAPHATRKPAAKADREGQTQFSDMLDKPDTPEHTAPKDQSQDQGAPVQVTAKQPCDSSDPASVKMSPEVAPAEAKPVAAEAATDKPATEQEIADFLAAVAEATGMKITPVARTKDDAKPADPVETKTDTKTDIKTDDQTDDATTTDTAAPAEVKSADAAAIVVTVQADTTAAAPEEAVAKSAGIAAATAAEPAIAVDADDTVVPADTKNTKPQTAAKIETPAPAPNLAPDAAAPETTARPATNPLAQPAAPPQAQKPEAAAQVTKPAPAQHDGHAPDLTVGKPADTPQAMVLVPNNTAAAHAADQSAVAPAPAMAPQAVALPVHGIAVEIAGKALAGKNRFEIRLDPPELGKIHVRLDVDHKGEVTSIITADRQDTFDLLRRDSPALERALQDAGVKTSSNGLQFSLRDHGQQQTPSQFTNSARVVVRDDALDTEITAPVYRPVTGNRAGIDIRV